MYGYRRKCGFTDLNISGKVKIHTWKNFRMLFNMAIGKKDIFEFYGVDCSLR